MATTGRTNLAFMGRGVDANWYINGEHRVGQKQIGWQTTEPSVEEEFDFTPITVNNVYGTTVTFELDKRGDRWIGTPFLIWTRSAGNATDITNQVSFCDWESCATISEIRWIYNNRPFYLTSGEQIQRKIIELEHEEERTRLQELCLGGLTLAERQQNFRESKTLYLPLLVPWRRLHKAIACNALPNKVRVEVDFRRYDYAARSVSTFVGTAPTLSNIYYRQRVLHEPESRRMETFMKTKNPNGVIHKILDHQVQTQYAVTSGTASVRIPLNSIKDACSCLRILIRKQSEIGQSATTTREFFNYLLPYRVWIEDQGRQITNYYYPHKYHHILTQGMSHPNSDFLLPYVILPFTNFEFLEDSENGCFGARTFGHYNNPELLIDFAYGSNPIGLKWDTFTRFPNLFAINSAGTGAVADLYIDLETDRHNVIIESQGDLRKLLQ